MIKMKSLSLALVCIIALSTLTACVKSPLLDPASSGSSSQSPTKPAGYYEGDKIVELGTILTVDDYEVGFDEFRYVFKTLEAQAAAGGMVDEATLKEQCVGIFKEQVAMRNLAAKNNITLSEDDKKMLSDSLESQRAQAGGEEAFAAALAQGFATEDAINKMNEPQLLFQNYAQHLASTTHKEALTKNATDNFVHAKHILISFADDKKLVDATEAEIKAALDKANEVVKKIGEGMTFEDAMKEYGQDPGQTEDGYTFTKGEMVASFEEKAFELKVGEMSEPVQSEFGYHIIKKYELTIADDSLLQYLNEEINTLIMTDLSDATQATKVEYCKEWDKISTTTLY